MKKVYVNVHRHEVGISFIEVKKADSSPNEEWEECSEAANAFHEGVLDDGKIRTLSPRDISFRDVLNALGD